MPTLNLGRVGFVNKGAYNILGTTPYKINDVVEFNTGLYACIIANTGQSPSLGGNTYWQEWLAPNAMHLSGNETASGIKTFSSSPLVPTAVLADNTTKAASTAFVNAFFTAYAAMKETTSGAVFLGSGTTLQRPTLTAGQKAIWYNTDLLSFEGWNGSTWGNIGGGATGGGTDTIFHLNSQTVTTNYTVPTGKNAGSFGTITIADGVTVTIPDNTSWTIV